MKLNACVAPLIAAYLTFFSTGSSEPGFKQSVARPDSPRPSQSSHSHSFPSSNMPMLDMDAARLVLVALRASLPPNERITTENVILAPRDQAMPFEAAATLLASMPKPLECRAHASDGTLTVICSEVSANWRAIHSFQIEEIGSGEGAIGTLRTDVKEGGSDRVLVLGRGATMVVPTQALETWARDYVVTLPLGVTNRAPIGTEEKLNVQSVIEFEHVEKVDPQSDIARQLFEFRRLRPLSSE